MRLENPGTVHVVASLFSPTNSRRIESLFNWIKEKTGIQWVSKVHSYQGLLVHAFGRLAAAMFLLALKP